jgi:hypothetical protein
MRRLATAISVVTVVVALTAPSAAGAYSIKGFTVKDIGSQIRWGITVCGNVVVRRFRARLDPEDQGIPYNHSWSAGKNGRGCNRWNMYADDIWLEQVWDSQLTVVLGNGAILRSPWRAFYIS